MAVISVGVARSSYPRFRRAAGVVPIKLTDDDATILRHIYRHRFLRAEDVYRLLPERSGDRLSRRLMALFRAGYLDRPPAQIDRFHAGGSQSLVYGLGARGARYLKETLGVAVAGADWQARNRTYTRDNLDHTLATARYLVDVEVACRAHAEVRYIPFEEMRTKAPETARPGRWPVHFSWRGAHAEVQVVPDAIFGLELTRPGEAPRSTYFFVEIDRGTMTIAPAARVQESDAFVHRATILRKLIAYAESWNQALHHTHFGLRAPRVLFLTTSDARARAILAAAEHYVVAPRALPAGMFLCGKQPDANDPLQAELFDAAGRSVRLLPG